MALRSLFKKGQYNLIKILSLALGLSMGLVLIAKVYFEKSYDSFYPDNERIYHIFTAYERNGESGEFYSSSGGIAIGIRNETPEVEAATRITYLAGDEAIIPENKNKYRATVGLADSCYMDLFPRPILAGDPKSVLSRPMYAMVSESVARKIGGDVVGMKFSLQTYPGREITIGGIYEDMPENAQNKFDILISLSSIGNFMWDGSLNYMGNERYHSYLKLRPDADMESVQAGITRAFNKYAPVEEIEKAGYKIHFNLIPITQVHTYNQNTSRMNLLLALLALALIFTAVMNYLLIIVSVIINRTKEIAVHKCYGASGSQICRLAMAETFIHLLLALILGALLILLSRGTVQELIGTTLKGLFLSRGILLLLGVCVLVFLVTGLIAGYMYTHIPVANAFRNMRENRRNWKKALLATQFVGVGFLITLLIVIGQQYRFMTNEKPGYTYENLVYTSLRGVSADMRTKVVEELMQLPEVAEVSSFTQSLLDYASGNNIFVEGRDEELFNIADQYEVGGNYLQLLGIPIIAGRGFTESANPTKEVMVERSFIEKIKQTAGWDDNVVGRSIGITEHSEGKQDLYTICGVYENIRLGSYEKYEYRPSVMFYAPHTAQNILVRLHQLTPEAVVKIQQKIDALLPERDTQVYLWQTEMLNLYNNSRNFRDAVTIGSLVTLLIALIGLIGYTNDELNRRRKEIAIRKVNGGSLSQIARIFMREVLGIALPALVTGALAAMMVGKRWQQNFSEQAPVGWYLIVSGVVFALLIILAILLGRIQREMSRNPVDALKGE